MLTYAAWAQNIHRLLRIHKDLLCTITEKEEVKKGGIATIRGAEN